MTNTGRDRIKVVGTLGSDWKVAASLAAMTYLGGVLVLPHLLAANPLLKGLAPLFSSLGWAFGLFFGCIALFRLYRPAAPQKRARSAEGPALSPASRDEPFEWAFREPAGVAPPSARRWSLEVLERIEWKRFEDLCCALYREKGLHAEITRLGAAGGVDIRLFLDRAAPSRVSAIVQCKAWNRLVGVKEVREFRALMDRAQVDKSFFMAPRGFSADARVFATENRIVLLDGRLILAMIERLPTASRRRLLNFATAGDWTTPTCPLCGGKLSARRGEEGAYWGCVMAPRCRGSLPMHAEAQ